MENEQNILDVIVVGAGQAGISTSYHLQQLGIPHIMLERDTVGSAWKHRWDSFMMNSPNRFNLLPGENTDHDSMDGFVSGRQYQEKLQRYAMEHNLPVRTGVHVKEILSNHDNDHFTIVTTDAHGEKSYTSRVVVMASGAYTYPSIPSMARQLPPNVFQIHSHAYRNEQQLPSGNVLIVGSATSGAQIAEDLIHPERKVYLATSQAPRLPRRYRGKDCMEWMDMMQFFDKPASLAEPWELTLKAPLMSGVGVQGHTLSLQSLYRQGISLFGKVKSIQGDVIHFENDLMQNIAFGDSFSNQVKAGIDQFIAASGIDAATPETDDADFTFQIPTSTADHISIQAFHITSVIWCTGFTQDFSLVKIPGATEKGIPVHQDGISSVQGLYFMGLPWMRNLKSSLIHGTKEDASCIVDHISKYLHKHAHAIKTTYAHS